MSNEKKEKTRKKRKSNVSKEENTSKENQTNENNNIARLTEEEQTIASTPLINEKMVNMDIRIKYGFVRHLHRVFLSVNDRISWSPDELISIGMIFRDFNGIEKTVYENVIKQMDNDDETIPENTEETNVEDIN